MHENKINSPLPGKIFLELCEWSPTPQTISSGFPRTWKRFHCAANFLINCAGQFFGGSQTL